MTACKLYLRFIQLLIIFWTIGINQLFCVKRYLSLLALSVLATIMIVKDNNFFSRTDVVDGRFSFTYHRHLQSFALEM